MIIPRDGDVFTKPTLAAVKELTDAAWQIPYASRVDSITNFQFTYAEGDDLIVEDLISDVSGFTAEQLAAILIATSQMKHILE